MERIIKFSGLVAIVISSVIVAGCLGEKEQAAATYKTYCGGCHVLADPAQLTKDVWERLVLPEMGARLGVRSEGYNPYYKVDENERMIMEANKVYPEQQQVSDEDWAKITAYVLQNAPDSMPADLSRIGRTKPLTQFDKHFVATEGIAGSLVIHLKLSEGKKGVLGSNAGGQLWQWLPGDSARVIKTYGSPLVSYNQRNDKEYVIEMGQMHPTEIALGTLWQIDAKTGLQRQLGGALQRPVHGLVQDLNNDGNDEVIVCEFGSLAGQLTLFSDIDKGLKKTELLPYAGIIKTELHDMNADGLKDVIVLLSQGNEGAYILFQGNDLTFAARQVLRLNPVYGTTDLDLVDYDGDGDMDIVSAHGDNADYSPILKPYHGMRLFLNDGNNNFEEAFFYPIYGANQVEAADFDADGDIDFAVTSFFPDYDNNPKESFVYLENTSSSAFQFQAYTFEGADEGRWIVMESGDIDQDGDVDIVLGSFTYSPAFTPKAFSDKWKATTTDILYLENKLR